MISEQPPTTPVLAHGGRILCVDFDGVLCDDAYPQIGPPRRAMIHALNRLALEGWYILVNSSRRTLDYDALCDWLALHEVTYHQLALGVKPVADVYLDDKGWLPEPDDLLMLLERRAAPSLHGYLEHLGAGTYASPFAVNVHDVPENPHAVRLDASLDAEATFRVLIPVTGGMDSTTLWQMARESGVPYALFYVMAGQEYASAEMQALTRLMPDEPLITVLEVPPSAVRYQHILPARNASILLALAEYGTARGWWGEIWFGALAGEMPIVGGDKSHLFLRDIHLLLGATWRVVLPLAGMDKTDEVRYWMGGGSGSGSGSGWRDISVLEQTKSCFDAEQDACGRCQTCFRKYVAFVAAGALDPTDAAAVYRLFPAGYDWTPFVAKYRRVMTAAQVLGDFSHYSPARMRDTLEVIARIDLGEVRLTLPVMAEYEERNERPMRLVRLELETDTHDGRDA